jgi:predicted alpha/beta hydrolase family esterase
MWQSNNDTICPLSEAQTFATGSGATLVNIGNQSGGFLPGHGLNTGFTTTQVQDFLIAND